MELTMDDIRHVARLARLELSDEEMKAFGKVLSDILGFVGRLQQLETDGVEPTSHVVPLENVMRDDCVKPSLSVDEALANAPDRSDDYFRVPRILEVDE